MKTGRAPDLGLISSLARPCQDYAGRIGKSGTPVQFVVIEGAHHKFDADDLRRHHVRNAARTKAARAAVAFLESTFAR